MGDPRIRSAARRLGWHVVPARDFDLVRRDYYSPLLDTESIPPDAWRRRSDLAGIEFDTGRQIAWAEERLAPHVAAFGDFDYRNQHYEEADAEIAYAMVRHFEPGRIVELGSGYSTLVLARAAAETGARLVANDPYPRGIVDNGVAELRRRPAQEVAADELQAGDMLFVDTTHVVKLGGDVNHVILDLLPRLPDGVVVHFHDIWLPYEYHRDLTDILGMHWNEQYLLQAFLSGNPRWEVLFATHAVAVEQRQRLKALVPSYTGDNYPTSFWIRASRGA